MAGDQNPDRPIVEITLLAATALLILGGETIAPALPAITEQFQNTPNVEFLVNLVITLPAFFIAINAPVAGYIVDKFGRKVVLVISMVVAGLAGTSGYLANTMTELLIGRGLLGIAVAGVMTSTTTLVVDYYAGETRARIMGLQAAVTGLGGAAFLTLVGFLADIDWRTAFLIHLVVFLVLPFVLLALFEPAHEERCQEEPPPVGDPGSCMGESIYQETLASTHPPTSPTPVRLIGFILGMIVLIQVFSTIVPLKLPFYLRDLTGATAAQSGFAISLMNLAFSASAVGFGKYGSKLDHISVLMGGFLLMGAGYAMIALAGGADAILYIGLILTGVGLGQAMPNLYVWLANEAPLEMRGRIMGGFTTALNLGKFLSPIAGEPAIAFFDVGTTILIAGILLLVMVPLFFATRGRLRLLGARPA